MRLDGWVLEFVCEWLQAEVLCHFLEKDLYEDSTRRGRLFFRDLQNFEAAPAHSIVV